ncbi:MAG TPA: ATP-binding protein [Gammaproteobacteria bacterium]|nr:ATP-binding protein [Gammaproteobacteria bacterium]
MPGIVASLQAEFDEKLLKAESGVARHVELPDVKNKIKVAIGMRRSGKTFLLFQVIQKLLDQKVPRESILYINFEDDRLMPCDQKKLADMLESFYEEYPQNHDRVTYLFLDEIQNVTDWPLVIRRFFDTKKVQIYLTGSSAKLLSKEIASSLRGRSLATEVFPYSFHEFLTAHDIKLKSGAFQGKHQQDVLLEQLRIYLRDGGFPEVIAMDTTDRIRILQDYINVVIFRDIIERYHITHHVLVNYLIKTILHNVASPFSVNKFFNDVKSQGISVAKGTLYEYLTYIEDAYLVFGVPLYAKSQRKVYTNPKKYYAVDPGLIRAFTLNFDGNMGHLFENLVYLDLRRQGAEIYYYLTAERYEVDFVARFLDGTQKLYQVVWDMKDEETMAREKRALVAAEKELGIQGEIITPANYLEKIKF